MPDAAARSATHAAALYLAVVQFLFVTCWTVYVIYLPGLLESAGLPRRYAPWILILDQLVFMVMDVMTGMAADRTARLVGRLGPFIAGITGASCVAFLLIPHAASWGAWAPVALLTLVLLWTATSSALRAPPWVLLSRHAAAPSVPWINALALTGLGLGAAAAPYLGIVLKNVDVRLPFAVSSLTLLATTAGLVWVERALARQRHAAPPAAPAPARLGAAAWLFVAGCLLLALGFQVHVSLNSAGQYLRFAPSDQLQYLLPVFWGGFSLAMFPGAALANRYGSLPVIAAGALAGTAFTLASAFAPGLGPLVAAQLLAGGAWGCVLMASFSAAIELGRTGREGLALGMLFAVLALATLARIATVAAELHKHPALAPALGWTPLVLWLAAGLLFAVLAHAERPRNGQD
jgi:MFS family permease